MTFRNFCCQILKQQLISRQPITQNGLNPKLVNEYFPHYFAKIA